MNFMLKTVHSSHNICSVFHTTYNHEKIASLFKDLSQL